MSQTIKTTKTLYVAGDGSDQLEFLIPWLVNQLGASIPMPAIHIIDFSESSDPPVAVDDILVTSCPVPQGLVPLENILSACKPKRVFFNNDDPLLNRFFTREYPFEKISFSLIKQSHLRADASISMSLDSWNFAFWNGSDETVKLNIPLEGANGLYLLTAALCFLIHEGLDMNRLDEISEDLTLSDVDFTTFENKCVMAVDLDGELNTMDFLLHAFDNLAIRGLRAVVVLDCGTTRTPLSAERSEHLLKSLQSQKHIGVQLINENHFDVDRTLHVNGKWQYFSQREALGQALRKIGRDTAENPLAVLYLGHESAVWIAKKIIETQNDVPQMTITPPAPGFILDASAITHAGNCREENEDSFLSDAGSGFFLVADGMGGHDSGKVASNTLAATFNDGLQDWKAGIFSTTGDRFRNSPINALLNTLVSNANTAIFHKNESSTGRSAMGTTAVAAVIHSETLYHIHAGDGRLYLFRDGNLTQITTDHSVFWEIYVKNGKARPDEIKKISKPGLFALTRVVGTDEVVLPELGSFALKQGDTLLLNSDGLSDEVEPEAILSILQQNNPAMLLADTLLKTALKNGGRDNITLIVIKILEKKDF